MIGIIGNGFVGNAVYQNFRDKVSTKVYDVDKNRSINTFMKFLIKLCVCMSSNSYDRLMVVVIHQYSMISLIHCD